VATFPFTAEGPGELSISEGDQVELVERVDAAWMKGRLGGKEGIFPLEFVKVIVDLPPQGAKSKVQGPKSNVQGPKSKGAFLVAKGVATGAWLLIEGW
jgi:hypothetical protein